MTQGTASLAKGKRIVEIDALRGLAVLLMVFSHGLHWAYTGTSHELLSLFGTLSLGDIAAPLFFLTAGLSLYFSLGSQLKKGFEPNDLKKRYASRLGKLFFIGSCLSFLWGVLQAQAVTLLALTILTLYLIRTRNFQAIGPFVLTTVAASFVLHLVLANISLPPLGEKIIAGQFPLFGILAINGLGFYAAPYLRSGRFRIGCLGVGLVLLASSQALQLTGLPLLRPGAPPAFILLGVGIGFLLLGVFNIPCFRRNPGFRLLTWVGKDALFLFVLHYLAFFAPLYLSGYWSSLERPSALAFSAIMTMTMIAVSSWRQQSSVSVYDLLDILFLRLARGLRSIPLPSPQLDINYQVQGNNWHSHT